MRRVPKRGHGQIVRWPLCLPSGADRAQLSKALSLFEPNGQAVPAGQEGKQLSDPEDLRALARVLGMQKTAQYRKRAIEILEGLTDRNLVTAEDQFGLARLYESIDDWPKARQKYHDLIGQPETSGTWRPSIADGAISLSLQVGCCNISSLARNKT